MEAPRTTSTTSTTTTTTQLENGALIQTTTTTCEKPGGSVHKLKTVLISTRPQLQARYVVSQIGLAMNLVDRPSLKPPYHIFFKIRK
jgi:hypothetical protein